MVLLNDFFFFAQFLTNVSADAANWCDTRHKTIAAAQASVFKLGEIVNTSDRLPVTRRE